jgi:hypothetical protein
LAVSFSFISENNERRARLLLAFELEQRVALVLQRRTVSTPVHVNMDEGVHMDQDIHTGSIRVHVGP